jgi:hypothetical protein
MFISYSMRLMQHHIPGFVFCHEPAPVMFSRKLGRFFGEETSGRHIAVKCILRLLFREASLFCFSRELLLNLDSYGIA